MFNNWLKNKKLKNDLEKFHGKMSNEKVAGDHKHPVIRSFETQEHRSDFIYRLTCLQLGSNFSMPIPDYHPARQLRDIINHSEPKTSRLPITDFFGCHAGKSGVYPSLKKFADSLFILTDDNDAEFRRQIKFQTTEDFRENIKIFENRLSDSIVNTHYFSWSNKYYLSACDCSHTIAAIYRQCIEQGRYYEVACQLCAWSIDYEKLEEFNNNYLLLSVIPNFQQRLLEVLSKHRIKYSCANVGHTLLETFFIDRDELGASRVIEDFVSQNQAMQYSIINLSNTLSTFASHRN